MTTDVKLLPFNDTQEGDLRRLERDGWIHVRDLCRNYARANMEPLLAENERLRAEVEARARLLSQHQPVYELGINRNVLRVLLEYTHHCDEARLERELRPYIKEKASE